MNDSFANHAVCLPAPALRPFISHYAGFRAQGLPPGAHAGLPSRHVDLLPNLQDYELTAGDDRSEDQPADARERRGR
jgi:hypothetical protein